MSRLKYLLIGAGIIGLILAAVAWQRRTMVQGLPPRIVCANEAEARAKAGPTAIAVLGTGSMAPFIAAAPKGSDPLKTVMAYAVPSGFGFQQIKRGDLVVYRAEWAHGFVIHQAAQRDQGGWIMSGLNNAQSESFSRVTEADFRAIISAVYVWQF